MQPMEWLAREFVMPALCRASTSYLRLPKKGRGWPGRGEQKRRRPSDGYARP